MTWPAMWPYPDLDDEDAVREYVRRRAGDRCEIRAPGCTWWAGGLHHRKRRAHGGPTTPENLIAVCGACHTDSPAAIHRNPEIAYRAGTLLHSWDPDPTERWLPGRECGIVSITTAPTEEPAMDATDLYTPLINDLGRERDYLERHIARHRGLGPAYNAAAHRRIGRIDHLLAKLYTARRAHEAAQR